MNPSESTMEIIAMPAVVPRNFDANGSPCTEPSLSIAMEIKIVHRPAVPVDFILLDTNLLGSAQGL